MFTKEQHHRSFERLEISGHAFYIIFWSPTKEISAYNTVLKESVAVTSVWLEEYRQQCLSSPLVGRMHDEFFDPLKEGDGLIMVNHDYWHQMPLDIRKFVVYHEIGHIVLGHPKRIVQMRALLGDETRFAPGGWAWPLEKEADSFAEQQTGLAAREALERFSMLIAGRGLNEAFVKERF